VTTITEDTLRTLTGFQGGGEPVTTCYLDVDGRRLLTQRDIEQELDGVLRQARGRANGTASVHSDLDRIEGFVKGGFDRSRVRGLALFSCAARDLFEVVPLPVRVRSRVVVNEQPAVAQLEAIAEESRRYGVLLVDRQRARMFVFELDELVEHTEQQAGETSRDYDNRGERERGDVANHVDAMASAHVRSAAALAFSVFQDQGFEHLVIGAPEDLGKEVEGALHAYLRERLRGRINVTPQASLDVIQKAVVACEEATERDKEAALVRRLLDTVGAGGRAVTGLGAVLTALNERRVEHLIVSHEFETEGWRCEETGFLYDVRPHRSADGPGLKPIQDVVEEAIDDALGQGAKVEICVGNADLDVHGRIGALLRY
jgi:peptide chain release factor subunit 1